MTYTIFIFKYISSDMIAFWNTTRYVLSAEKILYAASLTLSVLEPLKFDA